MTIKLVVMIAAVAAGCGSSKPAATTSSAAATGAGVPLEWHVTDAPYDHVAVTLAVAGHDVTLDPLEAMSDDGPGGTRTCKAQPSTATKGEISCGKSPGYNAYVVELRGKELVISRHTGVIREHGMTEEATKEVKRVPIDGTSLAIAPLVLPPAPVAPAAGSCKLDDPCPKEGASCGIEQCGAKAKGFCNYMTCFKGKWINQEVPPPPPPGAQSP